MHYKYLLVSLFSIVITCSFSQTMTGLKALDIPQKFILPTGDHFIEDDIKVVSGNIWEVYSDRTFNKTTDKPGRGKIFKVVQYLEKFFVVEMEKNFLHIVKDPNIKDDGTFSEQSEDYGWIPLENILVWRHCLIDNNGRNKRVFIFRNKITENYFQSNKTNLENTPKYFQVLYVLKEEKNRSLLAKSERIYGNHDELNENILGWVNNNLFFQFSTNIFCEPNPLYYISQDSKTTDIIYSVFFNKRSVKKSALKGKINPSKTLLSLTQDKNLKPTDFRMPIQTIENDIATVLVYYPDVPYQMGTFNYNLEATNMFYKGYCNISMKKQLFRKVLLLSKSEVANLLEESELLLKLRKGNYDSTTIANRFRSTFYINQNQTDSMILNTLLASFFNKIYGCSAPNTFNQQAIRELFLKKGTNNEYFNTIKESIKHLNLIYNDKTSTKFFISNGIQYYWIPCSYLP